MYELVAMYNHFMTSFIQLLPLRFNRTQQSQRFLNSLKNPVATALSRGACPERSRTGQPHEHHQLSYNQEEHPKHYFRKNLLHALPCPLRLSPPSIRLCKSYSREHSASNGNRRIQNQLSSRTDSSIQ